MRELTTEFLASKNAAERGDPWASLVELEINVNTTAYLTSHPETITWNAKTYAPVPMRIGMEEIASDGSLPRMFIDASNYGGMAFRFAKDNDLSLNDVTLRLINLANVASGSDARVKLQIKGAAFASEAVRFNLELPVNTDIEGPKRIFDRSSFKCIPHGFKNYAVVAR